VQHAENVVLNRSRAVRNNTFLQVEQLFDELLFGIRGDLFNFTDGEAQDAIVVQQARAIHVDCRAGG